MRSYEAARSLFSFLSFIAWCVIVAGIGVAILGSMMGSGLAQWNGLPPPVGGILGTLPGLGLSIFGFLSLATAQTGRAGVDSAEYGQQMLQISRDQLEVSRQSLRQGEAVKDGFEALQLKQAAAPSASYADLKARSGSAALKTEVASQSEVAPKSIEYRGRDIVALGHGFQFSGMEFATLDAAKVYIDQLGVNQNAQLSPAS